MARILIVAYGSLGDLHPAIALARGLQERGHQAAIASSEPYRAKITSLGLAFHAVRPDLSLSDEALVRRVMDGRRGSEYLMRDLVFPSVRAMHEDLAPLAAHADLLLAGELSFAVPLVAEPRGLPWAYYSLSPIAFYPVHDPSILPGPAALTYLQSLGPAANRVVLALARLAARSWERPVRDLRRELRLPADKSPLFEGKFSPHLNLALFSPVLQPPQPDWPASTVQTGFLFHDEQASRSLPEPVERFLQAGEPPIVFTLGSSAVMLAQDFYGESAAAAAALGRRALLLLGRNAPPPALPSSVLAWDYLPYAAILPRASAIVHQGGVGTTAQALRAGKPMLVMPFAHDQFDNAARVARLGTARRIERRRYRREPAARELEALLGNLGGFAKAAAIGAHLRKERGLALTCDALERILR